MSRTEPIVAVAGEALVDLVPAEAPDRFQAVPGGSPANVAVGLARLDTPVRMLARIGADPFGRRVREHLRDNGVGLDRAVAAPESTSLAIVDVGPDGLAHYDFRIDGTADWQWTDAELRDALDGSVAALHTGSLALTLPPGADALLRLAERARPHALLSYDPNFRPQLTIRNRAHDCVETMLGLADVIKVSSEDLAWLFPRRAPQEVLTDWIARGPAIVVVTLGSAGVLAATATDPDPIRLPAEQIRVVDTVGAGDAYTAGLLAGLYRRDLLSLAHRETLRALPKSTFGELLTEAGHIAAITCTRRGANPPTTAELTRQP
ncbi:carbohydrate kinase family protein [Nocardia pseudobrasiliensis]|uniref:Fructokinase n=1 Tax=Nocardia pseudobrasiliensis TaxID=45979 RepID=A0A370HZ32_9NOCA|nr:carbohydrate kinase [Nocardia pseudobrasiliensis]RDI63746.1 fructokinase [Nocardia pseudobrasiliensis]